MEFLLMRTFIVVMIGMMFSGCLPSNGEQDGIVSVNGQTYVVPESVNGVTLPNDPGEVGKETLLGIDVNDNGVRDDVERYIAARFQGYEYAEVDRAIAMQYARATQVIIQEPETAYEKKTYRVMDDALDCQWYYFDTVLRDVRGFNKREVFRAAHDVYDNNLLDVIFNTRDRLEAYMLYNDSLSGHVYPSRAHVREKCDFDIATLMPEK
jgi:hypothetical protein